VSGRASRLAAAAASFLGPALAYVLIWQLTADDTLRQLGYQLWLRNSTDDLVVARRMVAITAVYEFVVPVLVGVAGLLWWRWWRRRSQRSAKGGSQTATD